MSVENIHELGGCVVKTSSFLDGDMKVYSNQERFLVSNGIDAKSLVIMVVEHGHRVIEVDQRHAGQKIENCDAVITRSSGLHLGLWTGDCVPICVLDPENGSRGLIHAGWQGLSKGIIKETVGELESKYKTDPKSLEIFLGPSICVRHYEVKSDVSGFFKSYSSVLVPFGNETHLDLKLVAIEQLLMLGVEAKNIKFDTRCTYEADLFSHRKGQKERFITVLEAPSNV